ncbi:hypothetical protein F5Y12DRAFT_173199 [Xylaria sp. FL1777]|nr:hypothetical protein F5Y12DRAFT_173199 [Xylaria sp. FL1777]
MDTHNTMNNASYKRNADTSEITESPIIPLAFMQNLPRPQQASQSAAESQGPELEKWKSRVPKTGKSPLIPTPLFSSEKCVVGVEPMATISEATVSEATISDATTLSELPALVPVELSSTNPTIECVSPTSTAVPTTADPTPISPSPSLFPMPPATDGMGIKAPVPLHPSNSVASRSSVYSQSTISNTLAPARPRPASSVYSQDTLAAVPAMPSPPMPNLPAWVSELQEAGAPPFTEMNTDEQPQVPTPMEQVTEEQQAPQQIPSLESQVPLLRSPSLLQERGNRRRTMPSPTGGVIMHGQDRTSRNSQPPAYSPEPSPPPEITTVAADTDGSAWPLQTPPAIHSIPEKHPARMAHGSGISRSVLRSYHVANKESTSSSITYPTPGQLEPPGIGDASLRASVADSHTPICRPAELRSGWWSDEEEDPEQQAARGSGLSFAVKGLKGGEKEKMPADARSRRARRIRIMVGAAVVGVLIIVAIAVGAAVGTRK